MSNAIFPVLAGQTWDITKSPEFNTITHRAASGYEYRAALMVTPLYTFGLKYDVLRDDVANNEVKTLIGFFNLRQGGFDSFLYTDPADSLITAQNIGTGTGSLTTFQTTRTYGGFTENVNNVNSITGVYDNGSPVTQGSGAGKYTISATGMITFGTAPTSGHAITWTGTYYYRCRFLADKIDMNQFMRNLYDLKKLDFIGSVVNKV